MSDANTTTSVTYSLQDLPFEELVKSPHSSSDLHVDPEAGSSIKRLQASASEWRVAASLLHLRRQINAKYPGRRTDSDGTIGDHAHCPGESDHCPNVLDGSVGVVTAIDITHDPDHGLDAGEVAEQLLQSRDVRIKYIISNRRIASSYPSSGHPPFAWRPYTGPNPHDRHFHLSVQPTKAGLAGYDTATDWTI